MKCYKCGNEISYRAKECAYCGQPEPLLNGLKDAITPVAAATLRFIAPVASLVIPFLGFILAYFSFAKGRKPTPLPGAWYIVSGVICLAAAGYILKERYVLEDPEIFTGCINSVAELRVMQAQYYVGNGKYAADIEELMKTRAAWMSWDCEGLTAEECAGAAMEEMSSFCDLGAMEYTLKNGGRSYELKLRSADSTHCPVCLTPAGYSPGDYAACAGNDYFVCLSE